MSTINSQKWGFIFCPKKGSHKNCHLKKKIQQILQEELTNYEFIESLEQGSIKHITMRMTQEGYSTVIIIGGDAALNEAINGIMEVSVSHPILGVIPNGYGNDFAKFFMEKEISDYRQTIRTLKQQRTRKIDVGTCLLTDVFGKEEHLYFLDCINIGLAASITNIKRTTRRFLGRNTLSSLLSAMLLIFKRKIFKIAFHLPGEKFEKNAMTVCIGSATGYGQTPSAVPYNGLLDISVISDTPSLQIAHGLWLLFTGRFLKHKNLDVWRTKEVEFSEIGRATVSIDGHVIPHKEKTLKVGILKEEIEFLVP